MKLAVPIVNRTNYSKLRPVLSCLSKDIDIRIILSSSILLEKYGNAFRDIEAEYSIDSRLDIALMNDSVESMSKASALSMLEHSSAYRRINPDAVLIVGDRFDMLPAALSAKMMNIPILHIQGGERSGTIDDYIRDIISVCAEEHYVSTKKSAENVSKIAHSKKIYHTGCPAVESLYSVDIGEYFDGNNLHKKFKNSVDIYPRDKFFLVLVHPNTVEEDDVNMDAVLNAAESFEHKIVLFYPNVDASNSDILSVIRSHQKKYPYIVIKHAPFIDFVSMMAHCSCMISNSSSSIREAASFGTPVVNVGDRQFAREKNANTIDCQCNYQEIRSAISKGLEVGKYPIDNIYYKKNAAQNIALHIKNFKNQLSK